MNDCKCKSPVFSVMEFLNSCQGGTDASVCLGIKLKINNTLVVNVSFA